MRYKINSTGQIILADQAFMDAVHPGDYTLQAEPVAPVAVPTKATKRSFQNRFPKLPDGVSTKFDAMTLFLTSDSYATALGITGAAMHSLRLLIQTGVNRLDASPYVEMAPGAEASSFTYLLTQINPALPFALTATERTTILETPLADAEQYKG